MTETWAIILAAGRSERMGTNKLLMPFSDRTIIETVIGNVMQSDADHIMVVLGAYRDELLPVIERMKVNHIYNEKWQNGMLSSIKCAFWNLPPDADSALIFLGDQPAIPGSVASDLIHQFRKNKYGIVIPVYHGKRGHPVLISRKYEQEIYELDNNAGLHDLIKNNAHDILEVETTIKSILKDIDTMQDFVALTELN
jgi:CTP:molybdopterin cytidylyltransferase MocA